MYWIVNGRGVTEAPSDLKLVIALILPRLHFPACTLLVFEESAVERRRAAGSFVPCLGEGVVLLRSVLTIAVRFRIIVDILDTTTASRRSFLHTRESSTYYSL
jgi:hypothetical protein